MQKWIWTLALALLASAPANAQLGKLLKKAKDKTQQRIDQKVDESMDRTLDKAEGKDTPAAKSGGDKKEADEPEESDSKSKPEEQTISNFKRFDFIPGDSILYADDFAEDLLGELPLNWNTSGTGEVSTLDGIPGKWLRMHKQFSYLSANQKTFGENFTVEFDLVLQLKNNGWIYPEFEVALLSSGDRPNSDNLFLKRISDFAYVMATINPAEGGRTNVKLYSLTENRTHYSSDPREAGIIEKFYFRPLHISIQVQKERFRMWVNSEKVFDAPRAVPTSHLLNQLYFQVGSTNYPEDKYAVFVSNIKVATGRPDTRHKLMEEGRFSTTGILFDFQSAVIKPESYAVIKEIAGVLQQFPAARIKVLGHTSADGDDKANMELSQKRAMAVKDLLVSEFKIDGSRIESEGMGETQPIADNKTKEGKMANRRVEFVKL